MAPVRMIVTPAADAARKLRVACHHGGKTAARTAPVDTPPGAPIPGVAGGGASVSMASASVLTMSSSAAFAATGQGRMLRAEGLLVERNMLRP